MPRVIDNEMDEELTTLKGIESALRELVDAKKMHHEKPELKAALASIEKMLQTMTKYIQENKPQPVTVNLPPPRKGAVVFDVRRDEMGNILKVIVTEEK